MLYEKEARGTVDEVVSRLEKATAENKFGVLQTFDLKEKMAAKGVALDSECRILEICSPQQAKKVLEIDPRISTALPCRISVYGEDGAVKVATLRPTVLIGLFADDNAELQSVAEDVESTVLRIIDASLA